MTFEQCVANGNGLAGLLVYVAMATLTYGWFKYWYALGRINWNQDEFGFGILSVAWPLGIPMLIGSAIGKQASLAGRRRLAREIEQQRVESLRARLASEEQRIQDAAITAALMELS